jgi:pyruvate formate lyase activating enzyme
MDACNIDLKGFSNEFYNHHSLATLAPVLDTIKYVKQETDCWLEITTLLIEGENDSTEELERECSWIKANLGELTPVHFSAYFPANRFKVAPPTSFSTLQKAYDIAQKAGLKYVYTGNISDEKTSTTYCKNCGKPLIVRDGFRVVENNLQGSECKYCKTVCDGVFE